MLLEKEAMTSQMMNSTENFKKVRTKAKSSMTKLIMAKWNKKGKMRCKRATAIIRMNSATMTSVQATDSAKNALQKTTATIGDFQNSEHKIATNIASASERAQPS